MKRLAPFLWLLFALPIAAVITTPLSIGEMTAKAQLIVHASVLSKSCERDPEGRIYTKIEAQVKETWKGSPAASPLTIVHGGGNLGTDQVEVAGQVEYAVGEEVVAFLVLNTRGEAVTIGLAQGKFHVWKDEATGHVLVRNPFHGAGGTASAKIASNRSQDSGPLTLSMLKARVTGKEK